MSAQPEPRLRKAASGPGAGAAGEEPPLSGIPKAGISSAVVLPWRMRSLPHSLDTLPIRSPGDGIGTSRGLLLGLLLGLSLWIVIGMAIWRLL